MITRKGQDYSYQSWPFSFKDNIGKYQIYELVKDKSNMDIIDPEGKLG